ncbi:hypothetical protein HPB51_014588 [Rhipicephalus microplus]|uniref:Uncharacterized protein n=1 Tax=Rhipicephalus microplus TaxID=6941 RepID=A0A9J6F3P9_RHIMP|nr:hypothetical protein HPB51_014588 [Rhipicephalus microplus]
MAYRSELRCRRRSTSGDDVGPAQSARATLTSEIARAQPVGTESSERAQPQNTTAVLYSCIRCSSENVDEEESRADAAKIVSSVQTVQSHDEDESRRRAQEARREAQAAVVRQGGRVFSNAKESREALEAEACRKAHDVEARHSGHEADHEVLGTMAILGSERPLRTEETPSAPPARLDRRSKPPRTSSSSSRGSCCRELALVASRCVAPPPPPERAAPARSSPSTSGGGHQCDVLQCGVPPLCADIRGPRCGCPRASSRTPAEGKCASDHSLSLQKCAARAAAPFFRSLSTFFYEHVAAASWKKGATVQPPRTRWTQGCLRGAQGVAAERGPFRPPQHLPGMQEIEPTSDACPMTRAVRNNWLPVRPFGTAVRNVAPIRPYRGAAGWPFVSGLIACRSRFAARGSAIGLRVCGAPTIARNCGAGESGQLRREEPAAGKRLSPFLWPGTGCRFRFRKPGCPIRSLSVGVEMRKVIPVRRNAPMAAACRRNPGRESLQVPRRLGDTECAVLFGRLATHVGRPLNCRRGSGSRRSLTLSPEGALITETWRTWHGASVVSSLELTERVYRPA